MHNALDDGQPTQEINLHKNYLNYFIVISLPVKCEINLPCIMTKNYCKKLLEMV